MNVKMILPAITRFLKESATTDNGLIVGLMLLFGAMQIVTRL